MTFEILQKQFDRPTIAQVSNLRAAGAYHQLRGYLKQHNVNHRTRKALAN
jgi:hypothetical protein